MSLAMGFLLDFVAPLQDGPTAICATLHSADRVNAGPTHRRGRRRLRVSCGCPAPPQSRSYGCAGALPAASSSSVRMASSSAPKPRAELPRRECHLPIGAVEPIAVYIDVMEPVVGADLLQLTIGVEQRLPVP